MHQFNLLLEDRPGELARVTAALSHTNIRSISTEKHKSGKTMVKLITADSNSTKSALVKNTFDFTETDIILVGLLDRPGELHKLAKRLGDEGVNIQDIYTMERGAFALSVDNSQLAKARELLAENLV